MKRFFHMPSTRILGSLLAIIFTFSSALNLYAQSTDLTGIAHIALRVNDLQKSREFYHKLGFEQAFEFTDNGKTYTFKIRKGVYFTFDAAFKGEKRELIAEDKDEQRFWQGVRASPARTARDIRSRMRDIDRRIADIESYVTTENRSLAREIEQLR